MGNSNQCENKGKGLEEEWKPGWLRNDNTKDL